MKPFMVRHLPAAGFRQAGLKLKREQRSPFDTSGRTDYKHDLPFVVRYRTMNGIQLAG